MKNMTNIRQLIMIIMLVVVAIPITSQDDTTTHPLLELLSFVPDTTSNRTEIYYADMKVSAETAIGAPQETTRQAWESMVGYPRIWVGWIPYTLPAFSSFMFQMLDDKGQSTGFEVEIIERTLTFGTPPAVGTILQGDFDHKAIIAAYTAGSHELQTQTGLTLLCSINGCDDGLTTNLDARNQANPFGGSLGRIEPILLLDRLILNSPDIEIVDMMIQAMGESMPTLADAGEYQAVVEVTADYGVIRQAALFSPESSLFITLEELSSFPIPTDEIDALKEQVNLLPPYQLAMIADTADIDNETQSGVMVLVYNTETDATVALEAIQANLQADGLVSLQIRAPYYDIMTERGDLAIEVVEHTRTGHYLVVVSLQSSLIYMPELDQEEIPEYTGLQFKLFLNMVYAPDTLWLAISDDGE